MYICFEMLSIGVCSTRYWQTSGQPVKELNVRTVVLTSVITGAEYPKLRGGIPHERGGLKLQRVNVSQPLVELEN